MKKTCLTGELTFLIILIELTYGRKPLPIEVVMSPASALHKQAEKLARHAREATHPATALAKIVEILTQGASKPQVRAMRQAVDRAEARAAALELQGRGSTALRPPLTDLRQRVRATLMGESMLSSEDVSTLLGSISVNPRQYAMELRNRGELLGVKRGNRYLYPEFQFDRTRQTVYDVIKEVIRLLDGEEDPWGVLSWWVSPNARIAGNRAPKDLLPDPSQHGVLRELAEAVVEDSG